MTENTAQDDQNDASEQANADEVEAPKPYVGVTPPFPMGQRAPRGH